MMNLKAAMQYKISFFLTLLGNFLVSFNVFLGVLFMFYRFDEVKGYQFHEVILCFATVLMSYTIAEVFMRDLICLHLRLAMGILIVFCLGQGAACFRLLWVKWNLLELGECCNHW